jgi:hypothetical protein
MRQLALAAALAAGSTAVAAPTATAGNVTPASTVTPNCRPGQIAHDAVLGPQGGAYFCGPGNIYSYNQTAVTVDAGPFRLWLHGGPYYTGWAMCYNGVDNFPVASPWQHPRSIQVSPNTAACPNYVPMVSR